MMKRTLLLILVLAGSALGVIAQESKSFLDAHVAYKEGRTFYDAGLYGMAQRTFQELIRDLRPVQEPEFVHVRTLAELYYATSVVRQNLPEGENLVLNFIQTHHGEPIAQDAILEISDYYYNSKDYDKAIEYFAMVDGSNLSDEALAEVMFKQGYCYFVTKDFAAAESAFITVKDKQTRFFFPVNYYYGMCRFFENDYEEAIRSYKKVSASDKYRNHVPYYICQIYAAQQSYAELIEYAEPKLAEKKVRNKKEMHQLVGQAYFEQGDYAAALSHLEYYEQHSGKMRVEDFYQLAYTQYQSGKCEDAIRNFQEVNHVDSLIGQNANYYMADCYLKNEDRKSARSAFKMASKMDYSPKIQQEAIFNYGKLSAEMGYDHEAISALRRVDPASQDFGRAQDLLKDVFVQTRDYESAIRTLEQIEHRTSTLQEAYQRVTLARGIQLLNDNHRQQADSYFEKSLGAANEPAARAQALFWRAEIAHYSKSFQSSIDLYNQYFAAVKSSVEMPSETAGPVAHYNQGYNYLKLTEYQSAFGHFRDAINGIKADRKTYANSYILDQVMPDALLRAGDCKFKANQYDQALAYYDEAVRTRKYGYVYGKYQKAIIQGLRGKQFEKIVLLEELTEQHPKSQFADDALYQLAVTYQEMGTREQAIPVLKKLVNEYKSSQMFNAAYLQLGLISYNNGDVNSAINYYKEIFKHNPTAFEAQEALTALEEIYIHDLGTPDAYFAFMESVPGYEVTEYRKDSINFAAAEIQYENGNYERAIDAYTSYLNKFPRGVNRLTATYHRAESYSLIKQYSPALSDYSKVIQKGNSAYLEPSLRKAASICYNEEENFEQAHNYYTNLEKSTSSDEIRHEAQLGALRSGFRIANRQTVSDMASKLVKDARSTQGEKAVAHFYRGKIIYDAGDYDGALQDFNMVTRLSNDIKTAEARYLVSRIYYLRGQLKLAEQMCHNASKENSNYPNWVARPVLLLSDIYVDQGDLFNARAAIEAVLENFTGDSVILEEAQDKLAALETLEQQNSRIEADNSNLMLMDTTDNNNK